MGDLFVLKKALEDIENGKELGIATIIKSQGSAPRGVGTMMAILKDGSIYGTIGGGTLEKHIIQEALILMEKGESKTLDLPLGGEEIGMICGGQVEVFIDVYRARPKLLLVGGGHVGYATYKMASNLDFDITIFEDRVDFLKKERFPKAKELVLGNIQENLKDYKIDNNSYIIIATRGHKSDEEALYEVINSNAKYIGVMGSKRKITITMENLCKRGIEEEKLNRVYAPIGLDISSGTPEEIAVSIMAEVLAVKNNGNLRHMKNS